MDVDVKSSQHESAFYRSAFGGGFGDIPEENKQYDVVVGGGELHVLGEEVGEKLDIVPARRARVIELRPKYGCLCTARYPSLNG